MSEQTPSPQVSNAVVLAAVEALKLQLSGIESLVKTQHDATNLRIDDLRHSIEGRVNSHEGRIGKLEANERSTAIKAAGVSALVSTLIAASVAYIKVGPK